METRFTDSDISSFIQGLIELGGFYAVDESPDRYIRELSTGKTETLTMDGHSLPLACYGSKATDACIINPLSEGDTESAKNSWFIHTRNVNLSGLIVALTKKVIEVGVASHKKDKKENDKDVDYKAISLISKHIKNVDEKMISEFSKISNDLTSFFIIHYNRNAKQGELKCLPFIDAQRRAFPNIRVKTWDTIRGIISDILGTEDLADFTTRPQSIGIPSFETFVNILITVYERINDSLDIIGRKQTNLPIMRSHLKYLLEYASSAKWCVSPNPAMTTQQVNSPWAAQVPVPGYGIPTMGVPTPGMAIGVPANPMMVPAPGIIPGQIPMMPAMGYSTVPMMGQVPMGMVPAHMPTQIPLATATVQQPATAPQYAPNNTTGNPFGKA